MCGREVLQYGVSQIDGGTKLELGSYSDSKNDEQNLNREQFRINDARSLAEVIDELLKMITCPLSVHHATGWAGQENILWSFQCLASSSVSARQMQF